MKTVYVAGPYSHTNVMGVFSHMRVGIALCARLLEANYAPFCPWLDFQFDIIKEFSLQQKYNYSLAWLRRSDMLLIDEASWGDGYTKPWRHSKGTCEELAEARRQAIKIYFSIDTLINEERE